MLYVPKDKAELAIIHLTRISSFTNPTTSIAPLFILLAAKYQQPAKFGEYVARQNAFLNNHRNIAIVGVAPDAIDVPTATGINLWQSM
jgi:hypothetical protein